jgi:subtilisin family serine protease
MGGGYEDWAGTSMATPIVTGIAALTLERHPTMTILQLRDAILSACESLGVGVAENRQGKGLVQVSPALA